MPKKSSTKPTGRPSAFTQEIAAICERLSNGESLRVICLAEDMPAKSTVFSWLADEQHAAFRTKYALAREARADVLVDAPWPLVSRCVPRETPRSALAPSRRVGLSRSVRRQGMKEFIQRPFAPPRNWKRYRTGSLDGRCHVVGWVYHLLLLALWMPNLA